jgi:hypothetical protein
MSRCVNPEAGSRAGPPNSRAEAGVVSEGGVEQSQRMREMDLLHHLDGVIASPGARAFSRLPTRSFWKSFEHHLSDGKRRLCVGVVTSGLIRLRLK